MSKRIKNKPNDNYLELEERINKIESKVFNGELEEIKLELTKLQTKQEHIIENIKKLERDVQWIFYLLVGGMLATIATNILLRIIFGH
jgi:tetrahydromethanopterin S-methyltransferase subunit G